LLAPAKAPNAILNLLSSKVAVAVKSEEINSVLFKQGFDPVGSTQAAFRDYIQTELVKWKKVIEAGKISAE
jgi:tripartite-type tricarboxylate transporter receptor subunit TctC